MLYYILYRVCTCASHQSIFTTGNVTITTTDVTNVKGHDKY